MCYSTLTQHREPSPVLVDTAQRTVPCATYRTFPEGLTAVEEEAFCGCTNLRTVTFPLTLEKLGEGVFDRCPKAVLSQNAEGLVSGYCAANGLKFKEIEEEVVAEDEE